jgi:next-to-BRCA1 protein 1
MGTHHIYKRVTCACLECSSASHQAVHSESSLPPQPVAPVPPVQSSGVSSGPFGCSPTTPYSQPPIQGYQAVSPMSPFIPTTPLVPSAPGIFPRDVPTHSESRPFVPSPSEPAKSVPVSPSPPANVAPVRNATPVSEPPVHTGIACDACDKTIVGVRHKCLDCPGRFHIMLV